MRGFLLVFLLLGAAEIGVFVWAGGLIGPWWVVGLILLTGLAGITLAKKEGVETLYRAQRAINNGQVPTREIIDGICIFVGGVFLLSPGFITDIMGFILVLPWTRRVVKPFLLILFKKLLDKKTITFRRF
ncbi:FxsA family protein [Ornithinibacillus bavariensis]|uniref:FxsA family protein n=1 Tax=Ornithinibacillus bavariensis TaxID=545502 RepID=UPI003D240BA0